MNKDDVAKQDKFIADLHLWANQNLQRRQWWCLLEDFRRLVNSADAKVSDPAANVFLDSFVSVRRINTPLKLPDGTIKFPSSDLLPCIVRTIEASHHPTKTKNQLDIERNTDMLMNHMYHPVNKEERAKLEAIYMESAGEEPDGMRSTVEEILDIKFETAGKPLGMAYLRLMSLQNLLITTMRLFSDPQCQRKDFLTRLSPEARKLLQKLAASGDDKAAAAENLQEKEDKHGATQHNPRLGEREVHRLSQLDPCGMYWYYNTLSDFGYTACDNVTHMLIFVLSSSPVMFHAIDRIMIQLKNQGKYGKRSLALVDSPFAQ